MAELTQKQKAFADEYIKTGNATQSYKTIYKCSDKISNASGPRLLVNVSIKKYIDEVNQKLDNGKIADMKEVKEFWTQVMRSKEVEPKDRIKASELIGKTNGAFIDKIELSGAVEIKVRPPSFGGDDDE
jgi:phage terminase small subunit